MAVEERQAASGSFEIPFTAPLEVRAALARLARTEDVRFSPSGKRLAIAGFARGRIALADVTISGGSPPEIAVTAVDELQSPAFRDPHGLDFVDEGTLVVGNRGGGIAVVDVASGRVVAEAAPREDDPTSLLHSPGSVAVRLRDGRRDVLVCNNYAHTVTRHALGEDGRPDGGEVVAQRWLLIPDGLALSADGRWLAVSNHDVRAVFVYECADLGEAAEPAAILRGVNYPHGIRFARDGRFLVVADAGAPYVHVFAAGASGWRGGGHPAATVEVMDEETFLRGRHNPEEGGPKGIDVAPRSNVLAATAECLPLAFFDLAPALDGELTPDADALLHYERHLADSLTSWKVDAAEVGPLREHVASLHEHAVAQAAALTAEIERIGAEAERLRVEAERLRTEGDVLVAERDELRTALTETRAALDHVHGSTSWRVTAPLRAATDVARRLTRRA